MYIPPNTELHRELLDFINKCFSLSDKYMSSRHDAWNKSQNMDRSFIDVDETDTKGRKMNPFERQVYIPMSRASKDTVLAYWMQTFTGKRPIIKIQGRGSEDVKSAKLNEIILDYQWERQQGFLVVYNFLNDILKYGLANIKNTYTRYYKEIPDFNLWQKTTRRILAYEGPELSNTDPFKYFPDPRVALCRHQSGQFEGFECQRSLYYLKKKEEEGYYYNIDYLIKKESESGTQELEPSNRDSHQNDRSAGGDRGLDLALDNKNPHFNLRELWVELIPSQYGLNEHSSPQIWVFAVINKRIIIRANPSAFIHNQYPSTIGEHDFDGYSLFTPSFYESIEGLQDLLNWLYNSHIDNVRRFLNDSIVLDPTAVVLRDVTKPNPAKIIRLRKQLWGKGIPIDSVIKQLKVQDVTTSHIRDAQIIGDLIQRRTHTPDALQGIETEIKRTATEIAKMTTSGGNLLALMAQLIYNQSFVSLGEQCVMNNQNFLSQARYYRIAGEYMKDLAPLGLGQQVFAGPEDIQGYFDYPIDDGRLPVLPEQNAQVWFQVFQAVATTPPLQMTLDIFKIFKELARSLGVRNVDDFRINANIIPDERIGKELQAGNIIPIKEINSGAQSGYRM